MDEITNGIVGTSVPALKFDRENTDRPMLRAIKQQMNWTQAEKVCQVIGGQLWEPDSDAEFDIKPKFNQTLGECYDCRK